MLQLLLDTIVSERLDNKEEKSQSFSFMPVLFILL